MKLRGIEREKEERERGEWRCWEREGKKDGESERKILIEWDWKNEGDRMKERKFLEVRRVFFEFFFILNFLFFC